MPDFSKVTTRVAAEELAAKGKLVRFLLYPAQLGGEDRPENIVYLPPEAAAQRLAIGTLVRFAREGLVDKLSAKPSHKGDSIIPSAITYDATHSRKRGRFAPTIQVW